MCGIAALFAATDTREMAASIHAMMATVSYRGPDDEGYACFAGPATQPSIFAGPATPSLAGAAYNYYPDRPFDAATAPAAFLWLGHRRLAILDVSAAGHQPMCSGDGRIWIIFNGEIYNYIELRDELAGLGHAFHTQCDTEVILAAYRQWGKACLDRFNGMFAFVLFDRGSRTLFAARDRFGVKPLYYWVSPQGLVAFASEIKQFTVLPGWQARVNGQRAYDFLNWALLDHTEQTLFDGVYQLRNGEALEIKVGALPWPQSGRRFAAYQWYLPASVPDHSAPDEAAHQLHERLLDSIRLRLRADVPIGSCLSGGLDSSSIVCLMNEQLKRQGAQALQKTFSACTEIKRFDEREYIDEVVRSSGVDAHYVYPRLADLFAKLDTITWHQDEPFGSSSIFAQWQVFRLAAGNAVKVVLDGQGADESLAGYHSYFGPRYAALLKRGAWLTLWREMCAARRVHGYSWMWSVQQIANTLLPETLRQPLSALAGKPALAPAWLDFARLGIAPINPFLAAGGDKPATIRELSLSQLTRTNLQMLLHWEDRNSMAHSVESRLPFLDYRVVEFLLGLRDELKLASGVTKRVLRESMRNILPERIRGRMDKIGFATPEEVWLRKQDPELFRRALAQAVESSDGILNDKALAYLEAIIAGKSPFNFVIWRMISFGNWMRVFGVRRGA